MKILSLSLFLLLLCGSLMAGRYREFTGTGNPDNQHVYRVRFHYSRNDSTAILHCFMKTPDRASGNSTNKTFIVNMPFERTDAATLSFGSADNGWMYLFGQNSVQPAALGSLNVQGSLLLFRAKHFRLILRYDR